jgi:hypothetical protein
MCVFLQTVSFVPNILEFLFECQEDYIPDEKLKKDLNEYLEGKFSKAKFSISEILVGFFKFLANFDFLNLRISSFGGVQVRLGERAIKPMKIENPFSRKENIALRARVLEKLVEQLV